MFKIFKVKGVSMTPLYNPGDYVICKKIRNIDNLSIDDIVIAKTKYYGKVIKQISKIDKDKEIIRLKGINPMSVSSEKMGDIPCDDLWKVIFPKKLKK